MRFRTFQAWSQRYLAYCQRSRTGLVHAGYDLKGRQYHTFRALSDMPQCRYQRIIDLATWWHAQLTPEIQKEFSDFIRKTTRKIAAEPNVEIRTKLCAALDVVSWEMEHRTDKALPMPIALEAAALMCIGKNEDANMFDEEIHQQKISTFAKDLNDGHAFFLNVPIFATYFITSAKSRLEFVKQLTESASQEKKMRAIIKGLTRD